MKLVGVLVGLVIATPVLAGEPSTSTSTSTSTSSTSTRADDDPGTPGENAEPATLPPATPTAPPEAGTDDARGGRGTRPARARLMNPTPHVARPRVKDDGESRLDKKED